MKIKSHTKNINMYFLPIITVIIGYVSYVQSQGLFGMSQQDYALLDNAVKQIVHPRAVPTQSMLRIANRQAGPPSTVQELLEYIPHMQALARQMKVKPPGISGPVLPTFLDQFIMSRAMQWHQQYQMFSGNQGGGMFGLGSGGNMLMNMFIFDQFF